MKKIISFLLMISLVFAFCACSGGDTGTLVPVGSGSGNQGGSAVKPVDFDDDNVLFRFAVLSDVHMSYSYHTEEQILANADRFADAIAYMYHLSDGNLDSIMMCGDYTSIGDINQGTTFAQITQTIVDGIFKQNKPKLMIGLGNHDTHWAGCMTAKEWYELLGEYGLCNGLEADSDFNLGNLHLKMERDGKTYHMLFLETEDYAPNIHHADTVRWVDSLLKKITTENPDHYVFIGSHGPIMESGVYGTDLSIDAGANWATSQDTFHHTLKKYPQVVYFSGHTHFSEYINTTIMQKDYTAMNVSAVFSMIYYNGTYEKYLGSSSTGRYGGMGYYLEIDKNGSLKIQRVDFSKSGDAAKTEKLSSGQVPNPLYGRKDEGETISVASIKSCTLTDDKTVVIHGEDWILPAPDSEKNHLKYHVDLKGKIAKPQFPKGAKVDAYKSAGGTMSFSFPAAESPDGAFIHHYLVTVKNADFEKVVQYKIIGNYVDVKDGVINGTSHLDATLFAYSITGLPAIKGCTVEITAVDEYGNKGGTIFSDTFDF